jgi:transposase-like protein
MAIAKTKCKKADVLAACQGSMGICEAVCRKLGVTRRTLLKYRQRWPEVQEALDEEREAGLDYAENKLIQLVQSGDFRAIAFYLERKGRDRGWGQQQQLDVRGGLPVQPIICFEPTPPSAGSEGGDGESGGDRQ